MKWTTSKELHDQVKRLWKRGLVLQSLFSKESLLPKRLILKGPSSEDLTHSFAEVRDWCDALSQMKNVRFIYREVNHRVTGTNTLPAEAWLDSAEDAVKLLKKQDAWQQFNKLAETTRRRRPELLPWVAEKPLEALQASEEWERYLDIIDWMLANPRPDCYLRQIPWINHCTIFYWGDIDTHGFAILDELRSVFPKAISFLMDRDTLLAHQNLWAIEPKPCNRRLSRLTEEEATLYADLQFNKYGKKLRLEQERISFSCLQDCLLMLDLDPDF